jgi:hypothetical protein
LEAQLSPCYLNMMNVADIGLGEFAHLAVDIRKWLEKSQIGHLFGNCLAPPPTEYVFPRDLFKY